MRSDNSPEEIRKLLGTPGYSSTRFIGHMVCYYALYEFPDGFDDFRKFDGPIRFKDGKLVEKVELLF